MEGRVKQILAQYTENKMPLGVAEQLSKLYEAGHNAEDILSFVLMTSSEGDTLLKQYADMAGIESGVEQAITNIAPTGSRVLANRQALRKVIAGWMQWAQYNGSPEIQQKLKELEAMGITADELLDFVVMNGPGVAQFLDGLPMQEILDAFSKTAPVEGK